MWSYSLVFMGPALDSDKIYSALLRYGALSEALLTRTVQVSRVWRWVTVEVV